MHKGACHCGAVLMTLRTIHCRTCGCVAALIAAVRVRRFDGADTWKFLDQEAHA